MSMDSLRTAATAALVGLSPLPAFAQPAWDGCGGHQPYMMGGESWIAVTFGLIVMLVPLSVLVAIVALAARYAAGASRAGGAHQQTPIDILKARFARGEIDKAEYEERRQVLSE